MDTAYRSLDKCLRRLPDPAQLALGLAVFVGLSAFKLTLGHGVMLIDFLIIPVVAVGWFARSARYGYLVAVAAATDSAVLAIYAPTQASWQTACLTGLARLLLYLVILAFLGMMRRERVRHEHAATTDRTTGAWNAYAFHERATAEVASARRFGSKLSLAYLDLDGFKAINDELGHLEGDRVLLTVGHVLRSGLRAGDTVGRVGGDEFAILLPQTGATTARGVVERLRGELARLRATDGRAVTCSIGLVTFDSPPASLTELIAAGDALMYRAKQGDKDRVEQAERADAAASASVHQPHRAQIRQPPSATPPPWHAVQAGAHSEG